MGIGKGKVGQKRGVHDRGMRIHCSVAVITETGGEYLIAGYLVDVG